MSTRVWYKRMRRRPTWPRQPAAVGSVHALRCVACPVRPRDAICLTALAQRDQRSGRWMSLYEVLEGARGVPSVTWFEPPPA